MLTIFKPWQCASDLKKSDIESWDNAFYNHNFNDSEMAIIRNFNICYECLDARDDYRAQLKKGAATVVTGSWEVIDSIENTHDNCDLDGPSAIEFDDSPSGPVDFGLKHIKHLKEMEMINHLLTSMGWTAAIPSENSYQQCEFQPQKTLTGNEWEQEVNKRKQEVLKQKNEHNKSGTVTTLNDQESWENKNIDAVKIVDKSYLEKSFYIEGVSHVVTDTVKKFSLNTEQERAFRIIANHAISKDSGQLHMYLGGMGGTGKSQVIKALSWFFEIRHEAHRFIIVAPTGSLELLQLC